MTQEAVLEVRPDRAEAFAASVFSAIGSPRGEAALIASELVRAERMGLRSHGLMRLTEYVRAAKSGTAIPGAEIRVEETGPATLLVHGGRNFGQVVGARAADAVARQASVMGSSTAVIRESHHVGRLGALVERLALEGLVGIAMATVRPLGHFMVPWGGSEGRLGTNPLAYAVPTTGDPILADFATSVVPEGVVRLARDRGDRLVPGAIVDARGQPTDDPGALYTEPRGGLLPFGGPVGHKGYALAVLAELLAGTLGGYRADDESRPSNGVWLHAVDPAAFMDAFEFRRLASGLRDYLKSSPPAPGVSRVLVPGEREYEQLGRPGLIVDSDTAKRLGVLADELGVPRVA